jgi:stalled ribosome rescue protein Dom34
MSHHVAVWIDHKQARVFHIDREGFDEATLHAPNRHHERGSAQMEHFFHDVVKALADAQEVLICGPGSAKLELVRHVHKHDHTFESRIVGVETADHPTDGQMAKHAREYFRAKDALAGNPGKL